MDKARAARPTLNCIYEYCGYFIIEICFQILEFVRHLSIYI